MATYFYVMADDNRNIVTGVTSSLASAMSMLTSGRDEQTSSTKLVLARIFDTLHDALKYESYFLSLSPRKRNKLIEAVNPKWENWADDRFPAVAGMAFAESTSDVLAEWLDENGDEPGGIGAKLPFAPFDPVLTTTESFGQQWPKKDETTWLAVS